MMLDMTVCLPTRFAVQHTHFATCYFGACFYDFDFVDILCIFVCLCVCLYIYICM